jgi:hypothetical protein
MLGVRHEAEEKLRGFAKNPGPEPKLLTAARL